MCERPSPARPRLLPQIYRRGNQRTRPTFGGFRRDVILYPFDLLGLNGYVDDHFRLMIARLSSLIPRAIAGGLGANAGCACNGAAAA